MTSIRERNKRLILRAASEEFADKGFAATKTSDIAARAGLPKPNVYYYFQSKENLYRCVLESIVEPLLQASAPFRVEDDPLLALPAYIRSKIRISRELPHASKVFASEIMHGAPHLPKEYLDELNAQAQRNVTCLQTWIDRGQLARWTRITCSSPSGRRPRPMPTSIGRFPSSPARNSSATPTTTLRWKPSPAWS